MIHNFKCPKCGSRNVVIMGDGWVCFDCKDVGEFDYAKVKKAGE